MNAAQRVLFVVLVLANLVMLSTTAPARGAAPVKCDNSDWSVEYRHLLDRLGEDTDDWMVTTLDDAWGKANLDELTARVDYRVPCHYLATVITHEWMHLQQGRVYGGLAEADARYGDRFELELIADCGVWLLVGAQFNPFLDQAVEDTGVGCHPLRMAEALRLINHQR